VTQNPDTIVYQSNPPMFRNHPFLFVLSIALIAAFGLGIIILLWWYVMSKSELLTITESELRYEKGILNKAHSEVALTSIRSVKVRQNLFQRMFGTGDVEIYTAGDRPEIVVKGMPDPARIREVT